MHWVKLWRAANEGKHQIQNLSASRGIESFLQTKLPLVCCGSLILACVHPQFPDGWIFVCSGFLDCTVILEGWISTIILDGWMVGYLYVYKIVSSFLIVNIFLKCEYFLWLYVDMNASSFWIVDTFLELSSLWIVNILLNVNTSCECVFVCRPECQVVSGL